MNVELDDEDECKVTVVVISSVVVVSDSACVVVEAIGLTVVELGDDELPVDSVVEEIVSVLVGFDVEVNALLEVELKGEERGDSVVVDDDSALDCVFEEVSDVCVVDIIEELGFEDNSLVCADDNDDDSEEN
jgi:hypothetical protein